MTTTSNYPNKAIVVGSLDMVLNRKRKETLLDAYRTPIGGQEYRAAVQLITTEGEPYSLALDVHPRIPGYDLFEGADSTTCLVFEGAVRLFTRYDSRYAEGNDDAGRRVTEMRLDVRQIREPNADEPDGATGVWLEGTVMEPPRFERHYEQTSLQVGITTLRIMLDQASDERPVLSVVRRSIPPALDVQVAVPTSDEMARLLYRPGNRVRIDGELSRWMLPQYGNVVQSTLDKRNAEHEAAIAAAANKQEQDALVRQYRREVQNLSLQARTLVMVSYVEAVDEASTPISYDAARDLRREFLKDIRKKRKAATINNEQRAQRSAAAPQNGRSAAPQAAPSGSAVEAAPSAIPVLPRPRRRAAAPEQEITLPGREETTAAATDQEILPAAVIVAAHVNGVVAEAI